MTDQEINEALEKQYLEAKALLEKRKGTPGGKIIEGIFKIWLTTLK